MVVFMSNFIILVFFVLILALMFLVYKYFSAISDVVELVDEDGADCPGKNLGNPGKLFLLSNPNFLFSLYTRSYAKSNAVSQEYVLRMDRARRFLFLQYPLALVIFVLPILSRLISS
jgi:hypothetical protein